MWNTRRYLDGQVKTPGKVRSATDIYANEQDTVALWLETHTVPDLTHASRVPMPAAWQHYEARVRDGDRLTRNAFHDKLKEQPGVAWTDNGGSLRYYTGFTLAI